MVRSKNERIRRAIDHYIPTSGIEGLTPKDTKALLKGLQEESIYVGEIIRAQENFRELVSQRKCSITPHFREPLYESGNICVQGEVFNVYHTREGMEQFLRARISYQIPKTHTHL